MYNGDPEKKKGKKKKSSSAKGLGLSDDVAFIAQSANDGVKGSCEAGDLRAKKSKVCKTKKFNPNKRKVSKKRLVKVKKKKPEPRPQNSSGKVANPRFL